MWSAFPVEAPNLLAFQRYAPHAQDSSYIKLGNYSVVHKLQTPETTKPLTSFEIRGFGYIEFGGEGEIRTLDTISCIHTFQACSLSHSDTSPYLVKHVLSVEAR